MVNPTVLVEVLSPSTADYDRSEKLLDYQRIPTLAHVVHLDCDQKRIDVWTRSGEVWSQASFGEGETVALAAIGCALDVSVIFRDPLSST